MKALLLLGLLCLWATVCSAARIATELSVTLRNGSPLRGQYRVSHSGRGIRAFTNIPFAEPPIGELRFADPVPKSPWTGELTPQSAPILCPQVDNWMAKTGYVGQEDCLYLNVFAPLNSMAAQLPVMFFIHGGGWICGTGNDIFYGPDFLLDEDVILVTGNYRLGALGFLTSNTAEFTGNYGMKDQVLMMKWIQENIGQFGGDPNKVTIFGESAGAASVGFHLISPMSEGLFHGAILQSGTHLDSWAERTTDQALRFATKMFDHLGCTHAPGDYAAALACMRAKDIREITEAHSIFLEWDIHPLINFIPTIEIASRDPFLTAKDLQDMRLGKNIPIMIGNNANEGGFLKALIADKPELLTDLNARFDDLISTVLFLFDRLDNGTQRAKAEMVKNFYFQGESFNWDKHDMGFDRFLTDVDFLFGFDRVIQQRLATPGGANTYAYLFNYRGSTSFVDLLMQNNPGDVDFGVAHVDELLYLFPIVKNVINYRVMDSDDQHIRKQMVKLWVHFATTGNPSSKNKWTPVTKYPIDYMQIGDCNLSTCDAHNKIAIQMRTGFFEENIKFTRQFMQLPISNVKGEL